MSSKLSVAVMCSPAMAPMPLGEATTSCGVIGRPSVRAVATTLRHRPVNIVRYVSRWVPMFINP